jgi:hypothetical protein
MPSSSAFPARKTLCPVVRVIFEILSLLCVSGELGSV